MWIFVRIFAEKNLFTFCGKKILFNYTTLQVIDKEVILKKCISGNLKIETKQLIIFMIFLIINNKKFLYHFL